jgi:hypothetical protein
MSAPLDDTDFVDHDMELGQKARMQPAPMGTPGASAVAGRPPTRDELESRVNEAQTRIAELRRAQEELERERAALDEARRRRQEFETGRAEMLDHLTRGIGLLEKAEFEARRDAEQMTKTLGGFREALSLVQGIAESAWTQENWKGELTKALTTIENARMEWNSARLKWTVLDGASASAESGAKKFGGPTTGGSIWAEGRSLTDLCKLGLALTWPLALSVLVVGGLFLLLWRR